jgi:photosystem II stability/assembly factor-like uncharacterized protein
MRLQSTVLLLIAALIPVAAAFQARPQVETPAGAAQAVSWTRVQLDSMTAPATSMVVTQEGALIALRGDTRIVRSTDGGSTWQAVYVAPRSLQRIALSANDIGMAVGARLLLRSRAGGASWAPVRMPVQFNGHDAAFTSPENGYVVGGIGQLLRTRDAGASWTYETLPTRAQLNAVAVIDSTTLVIVGSAGEILRSSDGGESWQRIESGTTQHLRDVAFNDMRFGVAVGMWGTVLVTDDGGRTWTPENAGTQAHLTAVTLDAEGRALAEGSAATFVRRLSNAR